MKLTEWKLDNEIQNKTELVYFLKYVVADVNPDKPTKKDMQWLKIACNAFVRIAKQKGWLE